MTTLDAGQRSYRGWRDGPMADPASRRIHAEEVAKKALRLQLVGARQEADLTQEQMAERLGVTQSRVARIEKKGYEACTLTTLRRYVQALGADFTLEVTIRHAPTVETVAAS